MYKILLCWRYLRTRYIALASIISVMLGVATMIVVNSVMAGFTHEMRNRIHGILSDVVLEAHGTDGFPDADWHMQRIREIAGDSIAGMTPTVHVPAMLAYEFNGQSHQHPIMFIGIDERTHASVSEFAKYLQHPANREHLTFDLRNGGYDERDHQLGTEAPPRTDMHNAGWPWRKYRIDQQRRWEATIRPRGDRSTVAPESIGQRANESNDKRSPADATAAVAPSDPFEKARATSPAVQSNPEQEQFTGVIMGIALASLRDKDGADRFLLLPGDDVKVLFPDAGLPPKFVPANFTIVDFYESKMSEYDSSFVFVPIRKLQELRGMIDPQTGVANVSSIQIKLKPGVDGDSVRDKLRAAFPGYLVSTWQDKQGPLLAAVQMESAVLNILLFMIIGVAGFGILATFFMIVIEKTRDIGILKSLGASARGIMGIFLAYGLSLGAVGSGVGCVIGLLFVRYINVIRSVVEAVTGQKVFDPSIYYFYKIPTIVDPFTVGWIVVGALLIAVLASVLPALRAATLHPVEALRYE
jgi:lipoprotein-releasing system permease protein